jgi:hypothetical protein
MYPQVWGLIGVGIGIAGSMSGILLTSRLTRSWQRTQWIADNKKAEYRELLSALTKAQRLMSGVWSRSTIPMTVSAKDEGAAIEARDELWIMLDDRIFIAEAVKRKQFVREWERILHIFEAKGSLIEFVDDCSRLRESILNAALSDFGLHGLN